MVWSSRANDPLMTYGKKGLIHTVLITVLFFPGFGFHVYPADQELGRRPRGDPAPHQRGQGQLQLALHLRIQPVHIRQRRRLRGRGHQDRCRELQLKLMFLLFLFLLSL